MTDAEAAEGSPRIDDEQMDAMADQLEALHTLATGLVDRAIRQAAAEAGRTPEEQEQRMGDHFAHMAVEQDPHQIQLDYYAISGGTSRKITKRHTDDQR